VILRGWYKSVVQKIPILFFFVENVQVETVGCKPGPFEIAGDSRKKIRSGIPDDSYNTQRVSSITSPCTVPGTLQYSNVVHGRTSTSTRSTCTSTSLKCSSLQPMSIIPTECALRRGSTMADLFLNDHGLVRSSGVLCFLTTIYNFIA
jgi:hypothetical protein